MYCFPSLGNNITVNDMLRQKNEEMKYRVDIRGEAGRRVRLNMANRLNWTMSRESVTGEQERENQKTKRTEGQQGGLHRQNGWII